MPGEKHEQMLGDVDFILNLPDVDEETLLKALEVAKNIVKDSTKAAGSRNPDFKKITRTGFWLGTKRYGGFSESWMPMRKLLN